MPSIRDLFHSLGNKHNLLTIGCGATKEVVSDCLKEKGLSRELKDNLIEIQGNLDSLVKEALEADKITVEIHDRIYKIIDPDTEKLRGA